MKRATGITLAFIFLIYLGGIQVLYSLKMGTVKKQSADLINMHKVSLNNTCSFSFTPTQYSDLNWSERNKEFTYNGKHFDIISLEFYSDEIKVVCFDDSKETNLVAEFTGFMKKMFAQSQSSSNSNDDLAGKIFKEYLSKENISPSFFFHAITTISANCVLVNHYALIADIWHPPSMA
jgi:hypothetical protein